MDADLRRQAARFYAANARFATLGNSDAHEVDVLGCCYTEFDADIRTNADLVAAIRARKATPRERK